MKEISADWTDLERQAWADNALLCVGLRDEPVVVMQSATDRHGDELAGGGPRWSMVGSGNPSDGHHLSQPDVERGPARDLLAIDLDDGWLAELSEYAVIVMEQKLGLGLEAGV